MDGILLIHKEANMTSHDVVARLRRILHMKKIGHSGTLDPNATGVLLVLLGKACKVLPYLEDSDKEYIATMKLGFESDTEDIWGKEIAQQEIKPIKDLQALLNTFQGKQKQIPPMVSSIRIHGKKLYEYAREGKEIERPLRDVEFYELEVLNESEMKFRVSCSSGTYIRSLCRDVATLSGNLGVMSSLVRTKVGRFTLKDCCTLQEVSEGKFQLHSIKEVLGHYPSVEYEPIVEIYQGKKVHIDTIHEEVMITHKEEVVALYKRCHDDIFQSVRGLW